MSVARRTPHPLLLPDPAEARPWRPRATVVLATALMIGGAFGPWLAGKLAGDSAGVTLGGDGWLIVAAAGLALLPVLVGFPGRIVGLWALANAVAGGFVCLVHYRQAHTDGFRNGWGLYVASLGCAALAYAGMRWLNSSGRAARPAQ